MVFEFLSEITLESVMYSVLAFIAGMGGVILYHRLHHALDRAGTGYQADDAVAEAIVLEYTRRLHEYDRVIAELRTKVDIMELRVDDARSSVISRDIEVSQHAQHHAARVTQVPDVTEQRVAPQQPAASVEFDSEQVQNGTTDYILKMVSERPRSAREVQQSIGRTREHTSRLMRKLTQSQLVVRDTNSKPYTYRLTELGRQRLMEKAGVASEVRNP
jgi:hypothetical protein